MTKENTKEFSLKDLSACLFSYYKDMPFITTFIILLFFISSVSEAIGISALLVLLLDFFNLEVSQNKITIFLNNFFQYFGVTLNLTSMLFIFFIAIFLKSIILFCSMYISAVFGVDLSRNARKDLIEKLIAARYSFLVNIPIGRIITHLNEETDRISIVYVKFCRSINYLIEALVYSLIAILASYEMAFLLIAFGLFTTLFLHFFNKVFYKIGQELLNIKRSFNNNISNLFTSIKPLKAMGLESFGAKSIQEDINKIRKNMSRYWLFESLLLSSQEPLSFIFVVLFILFSITIFNIPAVTALFVAAVFYRLSNRLLSFHNSIRGLIKFIPSINSIKKITFVAKKEKEYYARKKKINNIKKIKFENITFHYKNNTIFRNLSVNLNLKQITVIKGTSGIGKTTFVDLISGLYKPNKGLIKLNNENLQNIDLFNWRQQIGYVSQDPALFDDTILNNLALMKNYNKEKLKEILKITMCNHFVNKSHKKLNTIIGNRGSKISGGQRQRLAIARALMQKPTLLILDEATSELNPSLENKILSNIIKYQNSMGIIIISHNAKIKKVADQCLEIVNKKIIRIP